VIWLMTVVQVGITLAAVFVLFGAWRLFWAWRDVRRERAEERAREAARGGQPR